MSRGHMSGSLHAGAYVRRAYVAYVLDFCFWGLWSGSCVRGLMTGGLMSWTFALVALVALGWGYVRGLMTGWLMSGGLLFKGASVPVAYVRVFVTGGLCPGFFCAGSLRR